MKRTKPLIALLVGAFFCSITFADITLDVSLGSIVGQDEPTGAALPFWGELSYAYNVNEWFAPMIGFGHRSNGDLNGNEYAGEYYFGGVEVSKGWFYSKAWIGQFVSGYQPTDDTATYIEAGVTQNNFRFTAFWRDTISSPEFDYEITGLKFGYQFDLGF